MLTEKDSTIALSQLALRNGQDKPEIWVAFRGLGYHITDSRLWRNGKHYEHWAGKDLSEELADAPHTDKVFKKIGGESEGLGWGRAARSWRVQGLFVTRLLLK